MDEREWLKSKKPRMLLEYARTRTTHRKFQLFACACCRYVWRRLIDPRSRAAVERTEQFADGLASTAELTAAFGAACDVIEDFDRDDPDTPQRRAAKAAAYAAHAFPYLAAIRVSDAVRLYGAIGDRSQADLLRHLIGNPFRPYPTVAFPAHVVQLAELCRAGEPCRFALHDALLDAGHPELADHFRDPDEAHPKGCWAIDLLLGKN